MQLEEIMGKEYPESFPGQMYIAFEKIKGECSNFKFKSLAKEILNLIPDHVRNSVGYESIRFNGMLTTRVEKESAWTEVPEFPSATIHRITAQIMWIAPKNGSALIKLWQQDPRQFSWQILNVFKLLSSVYDLGGGWH